MLKTLKTLKKLKVLTNRQFQFCSSQSQNSQNFFYYDNKVIKKSDQPIGQVLEQRGQIVHYSKLEGQQEQLSQVTSTTQENVDSLILTLRENVSMGLLTSAVSKKIDNVLQIKGNLKLNLNTSKFGGQIVNYRGEILSEESEKSSENNNSDKIVELEIYKRNKQIRRRKQNEVQVFTGNMAIDFTRPVARGHVTMLRGAPASGKSYLMTQTLRQHIEETNQFFHGKSKAGTYGIYCAGDFKEAKKIQKHLSGSGNENNFTIYTSGHNSTSLADKFLAPFAALAHANYLVHTQKKDVVLMFDNVFEHYFTELNIFTEAQQPFAPISFLKELFTSSGTFRDGGSLTTFWSFDENQFKQELKKEAIKLEEDAESLSDNIFEFSLKELMTLPKIDYNVRKHNFKEIYQNPLHFALQNVLQDILQQLSDQKYSVKMKKDLGIEIEPWDYYLFFDSKFFQKLLVNNNYYSPVQQLVFMTFVLRSVKEETSSQFKDTYKDVITSFFEFCYEFRDFENESNIFEYVETLLTRQQPDLILPHLERVYELFIMHLKMNDRLLPYKKDYLV